MRRYNAGIAVPVDASDGVLTKEAATAISTRIMELAKNNELVQVRITCQLKSYTRFALSRVTGGADVIETSCRLSTRVGGQGAQIEINQFDDASLKRAVESCEALARQNRGSTESEFYALGPQGFEPTELWRDASAKAQDAESRGEVIGQMMEAIGGSDMVSAGTLLVHAGSRFLMNNFGLVAYSRFTDTDCTITARTKDGTGSGWAGASNRDFAKVDYKSLVGKAVEIARMSHNPEAIEPGNRTVILQPAAVAQIMRNVMDYSMSARFNDAGGYPFSKKPAGTGSKWGQKVLDARINWTSDAADPDGGYFPFDGYGFPMKKTQWIKDGVLKQLYYDPGYAAGRGKAIIPNPHSVRMFSSQPPVSVDDMIKNCKEGFLVNRLSNVYPLDYKTCMLTGVTRDGCFLIKNGKIDRPAKNFRFADTPFLFFNQVEAIGKEERVSMGYSPQYVDEENPWQQPFIVPPVMVRDFAFTQLSDAI